jgi:hypothetical protein
LLFRNQTIRHCCLHQTNRRFFILKSATTFNLHFKRRETFLPLLFCLYWWLFPFTLLMRWLFFLLTLLICTNLFSQYQVDFARLGVNEGLSQNSVYAIHQDDQGFLWICTRDGLNRYEGKDRQMAYHSYTRLMSVV